MNQLLNQTIIYQFKIKNNYHYQSQLNFEIIQTAFVSLIFHIYRSLSCFWMEQLVFGIQLYLGSQMVCFFFLGK